MNSFLIFFIRAYQLIRPGIDQLLHSQFGFTFACSYTEESCSHYAVRTLRQHGTISGLPLIVRRVASCWGKVKLD